MPVLLGAAFKNKGVQPLLDAVVDYLPSPADMPPVAGHAPDGEPCLRQASDEEPFSALAFKIMSDVVTGPLTYFRVYSGQVEAGATVFNATKGKRERVSRLLRMHANRREEIRHVSCGNIAAAVGLRMTSTGDTLCDVRAPIALELIDFPRPTCSVAIEARSEAQQQKLAQALEKLAVEDPTFSVRSEAETGQTLIAGMGELHLEIIVDRLVREYEVEAKVGRPSVAYREMLTQMAEAEGSCIHQVGGRGLFAQVKLRVEPRPDGRGILFVNQASPALCRAISSPRSSGARAPRSSAGCWAAMALPTCGSPCSTASTIHSIPTRWLFRLRRRRRHPRQRGAPARSCWSPSCGSTSWFPMNLWVGCWEIFPHGGDVC